MKHLLITGASGLLGLNLALQVGQRFKVIGTVNKHRLNGVPFTALPADLSQPGEIQRVVEQSKPDLVINCAALANLDECEKRAELAYNLNAAMPELLAETTARLGIPFIHISTDAVFDGQKGGYTEADVPQPINTYAQTKLAGEQAVASVNSGALIARVNFYGWSLHGQRSLAELFYKNLSLGKRMQGFTDVYFCPLLVNDLVEILLNMVEKGLKGLYHVVGPECLSKYEFGLAVAHQFGLDNQLIQPVSWIAGGLQVARSPNLRLSIAKLVHDLGQTPPGIIHGIEHFHQLLLEGYPQKLCSYSD